MNAPAKGISLASIIALIRKEIGDAGEIGPQGEQGAKGEKGLQGPQGNTGPAGKQGPKGNDGKQGKPGKDGKAGKAGDDGVGIKDISQDVDDAIVITMTDGETYEIELPLGLNTEVHYKTSGGGGSSGTVDLSPYVLRPTTKMSGWLAYREDGNKGEWTPVTTDLVTVNPNQFRDAKGKFAPTPKELEGIDNQRDVNEFLYGKIQEVGGEHEDFATKESLAKEAEMRRDKDEFLQDQINSNQSQIDTIQEKGYDDTELRKEIADEVAAREKAVEAEKWERSLADIGLRDSLQSEIDILKQYSFSELDDKINIESETRRVADQGLQAEISSLAITLAEESSQRENADTELQGQIDSLEAYDDTEIKEGLAAEIADREAGDADLQGQIDAISDYDDTEIREGLAAEISTRESGDKALQKQIETEKQERSLADIGLRDSLQANIDAIEIPSIEGLATEEYVDSAIEGIEFPETDLTGLATEEYVDGAVSSEADARREADRGIQSEVEDLAETVANLEIPSIDGLASEEWVTDQIDALEPYDDTDIKQALSAEADAREERDDDLQYQIDQISDYDDAEIREGLAKESEDRAEADLVLAKKIEDEKTERSLADIGLRNSLQANIDAIEIPSLDGYATEEYVDGAIDAIEFPETDLSEYAKTEYVDGAVGSEAETRRVADEGLQSEIDTLAENLANLEIPDLDGYATEEWVTGEIDKIEFPETDLSDYAKTEYVDSGDQNLQGQIDAISEKGYDDTEIREGLAAEAEARESADKDLDDKIERERIDRSVADIGLRDSLKAEIDAIEVPSLDGYATEEWVEGQIEAIEFPETDLSEYAKTEYVDSGDANLQDQINSIEIPSIDGLATEEWVTGEIEAIEFPETDLTDYYTKGEVDESQQAQDLLITENKTAIGDEAQARSEADAALDAKIDAIEIPSLEGYATENYVDDAIGAIEFPETDLSEYAKTEYVDAGDSNLQEQINGIEIPSLDGYATEGWVTDQIDAIPDTDLSDYYTKTEVDESQSIQDGKIAANEDGIATNANSIEVEAEAREQEDNHLQAEIDQIALALEALLVQREAGRWEYIGFSGDNIPRNPGEFSLLSDDLSADENNITINQTDLGDTFHGFADVAVGDYVEIVDLDKPDEYALFVVDSEPNGTGIVSMNLKLKDKGNNFLVGTTCEIRFFQLNQQNLDLTELDARYLKKKGGRTDGILILGYDEEVTNNEAAAQIGFVKTHVDEAIQRIPPPDLSAYALTDYVDEADLDLQQQINAIEIPSLDGYATEEYVDTAIDAIEFPETDLSDYYTKTEVNESQQAQDTLIASNTSSIESEAQARADADTALDAKIDAIEIPSLEGYATEEYVDTAIDGIEFPETDLTEYAKTAYVDAADALLQGQIDALEPYDDAGIKADLAQETEDRIEGDASLQSDVDLLKLELGAETASRIEVDVFLQEQIDALEPYDDAGIKQELADEVVAREAGDANLQGQIDAIEIPSLDGYATEEWVSGQIDAIPETDLTEYAKTEYVDAADRGLQDQLDALEIPSLEGYATEGYVDSAIDAIEFPETDLSAYAKTDYVNAADASLQQQIDDIEIPSLEGYATEEYVDTAIDAIEFPETDLSSYYTKEEVDASQLSQDEKITANEGGIAKNAGDILALDGDIKDNTAAIESEAQARADADASLQVQIDAIEIPSIDGLATEEYVDSAIDAIPETDLSAYAKTDYVDAADANLQSQIDAIDVPDIPDIPDLSDYVSAVDGDQSMKGPLEIHSLGGWNASRLKIDRVTARSNTGSVTLGTMNNEQNLRVYDDKVQVTDVPLYVKNLKGFVDGYGCNYVGAYDEPDHIATKKDVEAALAGGGGGGGDLSGLVQKSGDTMTGTLEAPRINVKKDGEAVSLIEGNVSNTNTAARLTFSNKYNSNAYASLEWHGSSGSNGWFQFTQTVDFNTKGLHSVNNIRLIGNKAIQEAQTTRIQLDGKVIIKKTGTNKAGFVLKGAVSGNSDGNLLSVWHNSSGLDSVDYYGRQDGDTHIATVGYVKANSGGGGGFTPGDQVAKTNGTSTNIGGFWISSGALYVKVS